MKILDRIHGFDLISFSSSSFSLTSAASSIFLGQMILKAAQWSTLDVLVVIAKEMSSIGTMGTYILNFLIQSHLLQLLA